MTTELKLVVPTTDKEETGGRPLMSTDELLADLRANPKKLPTKEDVRHLVEEEFPAANEQPTPQDMDDAVLKFDEALKLPFATGQWVERLGNDMLWHLEPIRRTIRLVKENDDDDIAKNETQYDYYYRTSSSLRFKSTEVRCPQEALVRHFGMRPFLWQQWAFYKVERLLRFQEDHERDFAVVDYVKSANMLFDEWLHDPRNVEFLTLYNSKPTHAQEKLRVHLFMPFKMMMDVSRGRGAWDLENANASVYQYNSFLGSGWLTSILVLFVQLIVPILLLLYQVRESPRFPAYGNEALGVASYDFSALFSTDWETFCYQEVAFDALVINIVIFIVYSLRVVPVVFNSFYETVGDAPTIASRLNSLRSIIWDQGDDTTWQQLGFKLDRYMNSVYIALINALMLVILFLTDNTVDVILNALAIEFLYNFDRDLGGTFWYDPGQRYLRAAVIELIFRGGVLLEITENPDLLCDLYDIDRAVYEERLSGQTLMNPQAAEVDDHNPEFMNPKDKIWIASAEVALELGRHEAIWQFQEQVSTFGYVDRALHRIFRSGGGIFNRFKACYSWSLWEKVLFLPAVPKPGECSNFRNLPSVREANLRAEIASGSQVARSNASSLRNMLSKGETAAQVALANIRYTHHDRDSTLPSSTRFLRALVSTLKFQSMKNSVMVVIRRGKYHQAPFRVLDGMFEWVSYLFLLFVFPLWLVFYAFLIIECQPLA